MLFSSTYGDHEQYKNEKIKVTPYENYKDWGAQRSKWGASKCRDREKNKGMLHKEGCILGNVWLWVKIMQIKTMGRLRGMTELRGGGSGDEGVFSW